jgi:hypothetical protein
MTKVGKPWLHSLHFVKKYVHIVLLVCLVLFFNSLLIIVYILYQDFFCFAISFNSEIIRFKYFFLFHNNRSLYKCIVRNPIRLMLLLLMLLLLFLLLFLLLLLLWW